MIKIIKLYVIHEFDSYKTKTKQKQANKQTKTGAKGKHLYKGHLTQSVPCAKAEKPWVPGGVTERWQCSVESVLICLALFLEFERMLSAFTLERKRDRGLLSSWETQQRACLKSSLNS